MKGFILKDLLAARAVLPVFIVIMCLPLLLMVFLGGSMATVFIGLTMWVFCIANMVTAMSLGSYDEQCGWDTFGAALPVSRSQVVLARYAVDLLIMLASLLAVLLIQMVGLICAGQPIVWYYPAVLVIFCLLMEAVGNPLLYQFGAQKCGYIVAGFSCLTGLAASSVGSVAIERMVESAPDDPVDWAERMLSSHITPITVLLAMTVCAVIYALSLLLSITIYQKKEF